MTHFYYGTLFDPTGVGGYVAVSTEVSPGRDEPLDGIDHQDEDKAWKPKKNPWIIALTVTLARFMEVLDSSIANVSLPHIGGALGATQNEAAWVLTSYLVANAIVLPAAAYLTTFIGRKRFYMICVALFGFSSMLCALAPMVRPSWPAATFRTITGFMDLHSAPIYSLQEFSPILLLTN